MQDLTTKVCAAGKTRIRCPACGAKTGAAIYKETQASKLPVWCKRCRRTVVISVANGTIEKLWGYED